MATIWHWFFLVDFGSTVGMDGSIVWHNSEDLDGSNVLLEE